MDQEKLKLFFTKLVKRAAPMLVLWAIKKGWLTPDIADEATELLVEGLIYGGIALAGVLWVARDANKTAKAIETSERKVEVALALPENSPRAQVDAIVAREAALKPLLPQTPVERLVQEPAPELPEFVEGLYDPLTKRFFPHGTHPPASIPASIKEGDK